MKLIDNIEEEIRGNRRGRGRRRRVGKKERRGGGEEGIRGKIGINVGRTRRKKEKEE